MVSCLSFGLLYMAPEVNSRLLLYFSHFLHVGGQHFGLLTKANSIRIKP